MILSDVSCGLLLDMNANIYTVLDAIRIQRIYNQRTNCIPNINIRLVGKPIEHGHDNLSQCYNFKVEIPMHIISSVIKQAREKKDIYRKAKHK